MKKLLYFISLFIIISCSHSEIKIVKESDIAEYLQHKIDSSVTIDAEIEFWSSRLQKHPGDLVSEIKLGSLYGRHYRMSGNIHDMQISDSLFNKANELQKHFGGGTYRSLAANCVTQHRFKQASLYLDTALHMGDDKFFTLLQQFDVELELGQLYDAASILNSFEDKSCFDYYIRLAKLEDHRGHGAEAVKCMELAMNRAQKDNDKTLTLWVKTNLADMYGHNNRISEAYSLYLDVLKNDRNNTHALKGIAWIAFSHDKNTTTAKNILYYLKTVHLVPDYDLLLSEIANYEGNIKEKETCITSFLNEVRKPAYGDMYNKYVFTLMSDEENNYSEALRIAQKEVSNRPTSQSYDLLAWAYYKNNHLDEAMKIAQSHVVNKNFEPSASYHLGELYKQAGNTVQAKYYLKKAFASSFEMGPRMAKEVKDELETL